MSRTRLFSAGAALVLVLASLAGPQRADAFAARGGSDFEYYDALGEALGELSLPGGSPSGQAALASRYGAMFPACLRRLADRINAKVAMGFCLNALAHERIRALEKKKGGAPRGKVKGGTLYRFILGGERATAASAGLAATRDNANAVGDVGGTGSRDGAGGDMEPVI